MPDTTLPSTGSPLPQDGQVKSAPELAALRAEIDALDDALHDLVMRRAEIVARLAASRAKAPGTPLRAGREAQILRRLLARHTGPLPKTALVRLWRELLAVSTAMQGGFSVAVFAPSPQSGHARLAREHFGAATPIRTHATPARALSAVSGGEASVAVLPAPEEGETLSAHWWSYLDAPRLQVVARLPFFSSSATTADALVVAPVAPDPSGQDCSLLLLEGQDDLSRGRLSHLLEAAGLAPRSLLLRRDGPVTRALAEVDGFIEAADPRLAALPLRGQLLGAFAVPEIETQVAPDGASPGLHAGADGTGP